MCIHKFLKLHFFSEPKNLLIFLIDASEVKYIIFGVKMVCL
jgi:hypothetical protein